MAWRRPGDKPLSEPLMVSFEVHEVRNIPIQEMCISVLSCYLNFVPDI